MACGVCCAAMVCRVACGVWGVAATCRMCVVSGVWLGVGAYVGVCGMS